MRKTMVAFRDAACSFSDPRNGFRKRWRDLELQLERVGDSAEARMGGLVAKVSDKNEVARLGWPSTEARIPIEQLLKAPADVPFRKREPHFTPMASARFRSRSRVSRARS